MTSAAGSLVLNRNGRWEVDGDEFTSGERIEVRLGSHWILGRIVCIGFPDSKYVLVASPQGTVIHLYAGLEARRPERFQTVI
jgi:hypothetical protein